MVFSTTRRYVVARVSVIPPGQRLLAALGGRSIGVFNARWEFDLATRRSVFGPTRTRVRSYPVEIVSAEEPEELQAKTYPVEIEGGRSW